MFLMRPNMSLNIAFHHIFYRRHAEYSIECHKYSMCRKPADMQLFFWSLAGPPEKPTMPPTVSQVKIKTPLVYIWWKIRTNR